MPQSRILGFFVLAALAVTQVPGQQLTGVKSVLTSEGTDGTKSPAAEHAAGDRATGISARSIDKFTNDFPESDSKIINLSIKPLNPQVISGLRGARNLGFSADASLNAIPGTLNNELSNVDLKSPVVQSPSGAKDSYGNPVTPYTELGSTGLDSVGFLTDVNRDIPQPTKTNQIGNWNFKVPSYASGILEPVHFPPNPTTNFGQQQTNAYPTTTTPPTTTKFQFVAGAIIPTSDDAQTAFVQTPLNGLLPPLFPEEQNVVFKVEVGTERSPIFAKDPFGPQLSTGQALPFDKPATDFNQGVQPQGPLQIPLQTPQLGQRPVQPQVPQQIPQRPQPQQPQQPQVPQRPPVNQQVPNYSQQTPQRPQVTQQVPQQPRPTQAPINKFTGSFGGAPGFLGNQQNLGTAYTSTPQPNKPAPQAPVPLPPPSAPAPPPTHFQPTIRPNPAPTQPVNKFTGSFGGASGFLGNQQNLGTAYKPTTPVPATPQRPVAFQPPPPPPPQTQVPNIVKPPTPFQPVPQPQRPTAAPGGTYTGTFGFQQPQQPQPVRPTAKPPGQYVGNKFTGSFGGAPGLLGNQKQPGTHVKPDGTILPPSAPGVGFTGTQQQPQQVGAGVRPPVQQQGGSTFTGNFGGPPGILRPFDTVKG
uniref:Putative vegetative cell wall protein gp1 n=1 Tax=Culex tarsalis TaxID=7177 RepID=A0A1Q3FRA4_CULTA